MWTPNKYLFDNFLIEQFQKKTISTPRGAIGNSKGEGGVGGVSNAKIFKRKYETKLEFPGDMNGTAVRVYYTLAVWQFKPFLSVGLQVYSYLSRGLRSRNYCRFRS